MLTSRAARLVLRAAPLLVALALYGYTLRLVLFLDDGPHFWITDHLTGIEPWGGTAAYFYYRPAIFTLYRISHAVAGFYDPVALHALSVFLFGLAGVMVGSLARRLTRHHRETAGLLAGLSFVIFPFSYQTVTLVGAMMHIVLILCALLVMRAGLYWMDGRGRKFLLLAAAAAFWGTFNQENGVLLTPLAALTLAAAYGPRQLLTRRLSRTLTLLLPLAGITVLYLVLYLVVPKAPSLGGLQNGDNILQSAATLLQSLVYPAAALVRPLVSVTPAPLEMFALVAIVLLPALAYALRRLRHERALWYGLGWYGLGITPAMLMLDQFYVSGSPRILIFASVGFSLFWAILLTDLLARGRALKMVALAMISAALVTSLPFLNERRDHFELQNIYQRRLNELIAHQPFPIETPTLLVNAPDYLTPLETDRTFLRGTEGAAMMYYQTDYDLQIWVNTGLRLPTLDTVKYHQTLRAQGYSMYAHDPLVEQPALAEAVRSHDALYVTQFVGRDFFPVYVGGPNLPGPDEPRVTFADGQIALTQMEALYAPAQRILHVRLRWQVNTPREAQVFTHVVCDGQLAAQVDAAPWGETYPFTFWQPGEIQTDLREIRLSETFDADRCILLVGLYQPEDGLRLSAVAVRSGSPFSDNAVPIPILGETDAVFPFAGGE